MGQIRYLIVIACAFVIYAFTIGAAQNTGSTLELGAGSECYIDAGDVNDVESTDQLACAICKRAVYCKRNEEYKTCI